MTAYRSAEPSTGRCTNLSICQGTSYERTPAHAGGGVNRRAVQLARLLVFATALATVVIAAAAPRQ
jgi:hypothetical protein